MQVSESLSPKWEEHVLIPECGWTLGGADTVGRLTQVFDGVRGFKNTSQV